MTEVSAPLIYVQLRATYVPPCGKWQVLKRLDLKGCLMSGTLCKTSQIYAGISKQNGLTLHSFL